jgi:hypothetical protein
MITFEIFGYNLLMSDQDYLLFGLGVTVVVILANLIGFLLLPPLIAKMKK